MKLKFIALLFLAATASAQVALYSDVKPRFYDSLGNVLAGGYVQTYAAGTTSPLVTYQDSGGTIALPNPIPVDSNGYAANAPSNGVETEIYLTNAAYKFCVYDLNNVQQYCLDNITSYLAILNGSFTWTGMQIFPTIGLTAIDNQIEFLQGTTVTETLDFPPPIAPGVVLHFPNVNDTVVARTTTDTLLNKTLTSPIITTPTINGVQMNNTPGAYFDLANSSFGTTLNSLVNINTSISTAFAGTPSAGATGGVLGLCVGTCGTSGTATIQQSGSAFCNFDGTTVNGDYISISPTVNGDCHDAGAAYPSAGQVLGRVLTSNTGAGTYLVDLFGPEIQTTASAGGTVSFTAGTGAGTGPVIGCSGAANNCQDRGGLFTVTTGTTPSASNTIVTITFAISHTKTFCTFSPASTTAVAAPVYISTGSSAGPVALNSTGSALTGSTTYSFSYVCNFQN